MGSRFYLQGTLSFTLFKNYKLDYTRGAGGPKGLVSNHLKSVWIRGNEEDGGNILKRMDDARFSLFDSDYEIKPSKVVIFC